MLARRFLCTTVPLVDSLTVVCKAMQFCLSYMIGSDRLVCLDSGGGGTSFCLCLSSSLENGNNLARYVSIFQVFKCVQTLYIRSSDFVMIIGYPVSDHLSFVL